MDLACHGGRFKQVDKNLELNAAVALISAVIPVKTFLKSERTIERRQIAATHLRAERWTA